MSDIKEIEYPRLKCLKAGEGIRRLPPDISPKIHIRGNNMLERKTTWRKELQLALERSGEKWEDFEVITLSNKELDIEFDQLVGRDFDNNYCMAWTNNRVYFPDVTYSEDIVIRSIPRNPSKKQTARHYLIEILNNA